MHIDLKTKRILANLSREEWEALAIFAREMANNSQNIFKEGKIQENEFTKDELEVKITKLLDELRAPTHVKGYIYFKEAIMLVYDESSCIQAVSKMLYPEIAKKYGATINSVESSIDNFLSIMFRNSNCEALNKFISHYPYLKKNHSNKKVISAFVEYVKLYI